MALALEISITRRLENLLTSWLVGLLTLRTALARA